MSALRRGGAPGTSARADVPGSSANLGPGYDAVGLALELRDELEVEVLPADHPAAAAAPTGAPGAVVAVEGQGVGRVGEGEGHLVVRALRAALARAGAPQPVLGLRCRNGVPFGRGAGSSAAAVVGGVVLARGLLEDPSALDDEVALDVAATMEGHADNAAASLLGGVTLGWVEGAADDGDDGAGMPLPGRRAGLRFRAVRVEPHPDLRVVLAVPGVELLTATARAMLPAVVPHADAAFVAGRSALLPQALSRVPELLLPATADRLHQRYRATAAPATAALVADLRGRGLAAAVSGAGPSVVVLGTSAALRDEVAAHAPGWDVLAPDVAREGARWSAG